MICERNCRICRLQIYCQGCSFCEAPFCRKNCESCFALCPHRPAAYSYLKKLGGGELELLGNQKKELPSCIPVLPDHFPTPIHVRNTIALHGGNMMSSSGENVARVYRERGIQGALNLKYPVKSILQFYVKDRTLEGIWDNRKEIYKQLKELSPELVIAPNFSVYEDAPRMDHLYNIKRSSVIYNEMLEAGLPAIPDVSWYNRIDLDQWVREIVKRQVKMIAFSFQTVSTQSKASNTWRHYLMGFHYLMSRLPEELVVVVAGLVSPERLRYLRSAGNGRNRISVLNQTAYIQSRRGILSEKQNTGEAQAPAEMDKNTILLRNLEYYEAAYARLGLEGERRCQNQEITATALRLEATRRPTMSRRWGSAW